LLGQYLILFAWVALSSFGYAWLAVSGAVQIYDAVTGAVTVIGYLALQLALLAVSVRRVHDMNLKGWWAVVPIFNPFGFVRRGTPGPNRFG
jgi:uncharacterized membrane protein YhaH (DUF805 family)